MARRVVAAALSDAGVAGQDAFSVELVVSELVGNVLRHAAPSEVALHWAVGSGWIRIEVCDEDPGLPNPRTAGPTDERGRGLQLVEAIANRWGASPLPDGHGKAVWAEIDLGS